MTKVGLRMGPYLDMLLNIRKPTGTMTVEDTNEFSTNNPLSSSIVLLAIGAIGVGSFYFSRIPIPEQYQGLVDAESFKFQVMIAPAFMLTLAIVSGHFLTRQAGLGTPVLDAALSGRFLRSTLLSQLSWAAVAAVVLISVIKTGESLLERYIGANALASVLPYDTSLHAASRIAYGAFAEEVIMRWGLFGALAWVALKLLKGVPRNVALGAAVLIASTITTAMHMPTIYQSFDAPPSTVVFFSFLVGLLASAIACELFISYGFGAAVLFKLLVVIGTL